MSLKRNQRDAKAEQRHQEIERRRSARADRKTIESEVAHIPDRDQIFHDPRGTSPAALAEALRNSWSGDLEAQVKGERDLKHGLDEELMAVMPEHVTPIPLRTDLGERHPAIFAKGSSSLTAIELAQIARLLAERRHDLERVLVAQQQYVREQLAPTDATEATVDFNHPADMVQSDPDYERELKLLGRERAELTLVNQALSRVKEGRFGTCENCGKDIPTQRLFAMPYAKTCVSCQAQDEAEEADVVRTTT